MAVPHTQPRLADYIWKARGDGQRYEVIDGVLHVSATPSRKHQKVITRLGSILDFFTYTRQHGQVYVAPFCVVLDAFTSVESDIVCVSPKRVHLLSDRGIEGAPDLAVEVLSPSTRMVDRGTKMQRYARADVPHYWIIDPIALTLEAYELHDGVYVLTANLRDDDQFSPPLFPSLTIPLTRLWA